MPMLRSRKPNIKGYVANDDRLAFTGGVSYTTEKDVAAVETLPEQRISAESDRFGRRRASGPVPFRRKSRAR